MKYHIYEMLKKGMDLLLPKLKDEYKYTLWFDDDSGLPEISIKDKKTKKEYHLKIFEFRDWGFEYIDFEIPAKYLKEEK